MNRLLIDVCQMENRNKHAREVGLMMKGRLNVTWLQKKRLPASMLLPAMSKSQWLECALAAAGLTKLSTYIWKGNEGKQ